MLSELFRRVHGLVPSGSSETRPCGRVLAKRIKLKDVPGGRGKFPKRTYCERRTNRVQCLGWENRRGRGAPRKRVPGLRCWPCESWSCHKERKDEWGKPGQPAAD